MLGVAPERLGVVDVFAVFEEIVIAVIDPKVSLQNKTVAAPVSLRAQEVAMH